MGFLLLFWGLLFVRKGPPLYAETPPQKVAPAVPAPPSQTAASTFRGPTAMPLTHEEQLELQNLQLQLKDLQNDAQLRVLNLRSQVQQYEENVKKAHPKEPFHLDYNLLEWIRNPEKKGPIK